MCRPTTILIIFVSAFSNNFTMQSMISMSPALTHSLYLQEIFEVLLLFLEQKLGPRFDEFTRSAWDHFAQEFSDAIDSLVVGEVEFH